MDQDAQMARYVHLKDQQFHRYVVAGDRWDGRVYHQENTTRANAVWAVVEGDAAASFYRLIDLKHGMHLIDAYGQSGYAIGELANVPVRDNPLDNRARWMISKVSET